MCNKLEKDFLSPLDLYCNKDNQSEIIINNMENKGRESDPLLEALHTEY